MMKRALVVFGIVIAMAGCSKGSDRVARMRGFKDKVCGCTDSECRFAVTKELNAFTEELRKDLAEISAEERAEIAAISRELASCITNGR
ncbi:MAG: hypothetical protein KF773_13555 [Deltaproteobacteria bacterium]|nr:hypothetical protein [Deltaproteobacteria bacterium]MCW5807946.1 hypothetical protein [Deltaproteobacteria bacterium]